MRWATASTAAVIAGRLLFILYSLWIFRDCMVESFIYDRANRKEGRPCVQGLFSGARRLLQGSHHPQGQTTRFVLYTKVPPV